MTGVDRGHAVTGDPGPHDVAPVEHPPVEHPPDEWIHPPTGAFPITGSNARSMLRRALADGGPAPAPAHLRAYVTECDHMGKSGKILD